MRRRGSICNRCHEGSTRLFALNEDTVGRRLETSQWRRACQHQFRIYVVVAVEVVKPKQVKETMVTKKSGVASEWSRCRCTERNRTLQKPELNAKDVDVFELNEDQSSVLPEIVHPLDVQPQ
jgi:hypothetical protein